MRNSHNSFAASTLVLVLLLSNLLPIFAKPAPVLTEVQPLIPPVKLRASAEDSTTIDLIHNLALAAEILVPAGGDVQGAIDLAQPGDTIQLESGTEYVCPDGGCVLPVKSGASFITITSSRAAEIVGRAGPAQAHLLARVRSANSFDSTFSTEPFAHHFKLIGLEILPAPNGQAFDVVRLGSGTADQNTLEEVPHHIDIEKCWIHGGATQEVQRGVALNGAEISIVDSTIDDIHGQGYDTQAVGGWNGPGPFRIINNHFEGAGENLMFGGSDPSIANLVPSGIEIRRNTFFKPLSWRVGHATYAGIHWTVKNLLELKNARNVVIDGNIFQNNWVDAQVGHGILFTVRNDNLTAPWSIVENVTFTNNIVRNSEGGALNLLGMDDVAVARGTTSQRATGLRIANNVFDNSSHFLTISGYYNVTIERNTHLQSGNTMLLYGEQSLGFAYRDNLTIENPYGVFGDGGTIGTAALERYAPGYEFTGNVMAHPYGVNPPGNEYPASLTLTADYRSDWVGKGADIDLLNAALAGETTVPLPSPTIVPSPSPTSTPTPAPTPLPSPSPMPLPLRTLSYPKSEAKRNAIIAAQWQERFRLKRELDGPLAEFEFVP